MTEHSPITPPPELVGRWLGDIYGVCVAPDESSVYIANLAAQWGADQELEACCRELEYNFMPDSGSLRAARRPKSLKEHALQELDKVNMLWATEEFGKDTLNSLETIRKALEALPDD